MTLVSGVARKLIKDVPEGLGGKGIVVSPDSLMKVIEVLPGTGRKIMFMDDVWDFSPMFKLLSTGNHVLDFRLVPLEMKDAFKEYACILLDRGFKVRCVHNKLFDINRALHLAMMQTGEDDARLLSEIDLFSALDGIGISYMRQIIGALCDFYRMMSHRGYQHVVDISVFPELLVKVSDMAKYVKHEHYGNIPDVFFDAIIRMYDRVMRDERIPFDDRMAAGVLLVNSQLGLRVSEVSILRKDCLHWVACDDGVRRPYIIYQSLKAARGRNEAVNVETLCTDIALQTLEYLIPLREKGSRSGANDFLFRLEETSVRGREDMPHRSERLNDFNIKLFRRYLPESKMPWKGLKRRRFKHDDCFYTIPSIHNFRVHFAVTLFEQGVQYSYIESMMSHSPESDSGNPYYSSIKPSWEKKGAIMEIASLPGAEQLDEFLQTLVNDETKEGLQ